MVALFVPLATASHLGGTSSLKTTSVHNPLRAAANKIQQGDHDAPHHVDWPLLAAAAFKRAKQGGGSEAAKYDWSGEAVHFESPPHRGDLAVNLAFGATILWLPLSFAAIIRAASVKYRFTDKRMSVITTSPWSSAPPAVCSTPVLHELDTQQGAAGVVRCLDQLLSCCTPHGCPPACRVMRLGQGDRLHEMTSCATGPRYGCSSGMECKNTGRGVLAARCCSCAHSHVRWSMQLLIRAKSCAVTLLRLNKCHSCVGVSWFLSPSPMLTSEK